MYKLSKFINAIYYLLMIFICLLGYKPGYAQTEYKISTEGFTFEKPVGHSVILKIYLSVANAGALEEFPGEVKKIKLKSSNYSFDKEIFFIDYKKIIGNGDNLTNFSVYSLSFLVPVDASNIKIEFPERYGGLSIDVTKKNYNEWAKTNSDESLSKKTVLPSFTQYLGFGISLEGGVFSNSVANNQSIATGTLGLELLPRIYNFGREKKSTIFGTLNFHWGGLFKKGDAEGLNSFYKQDTNVYKFYNKEISDSSLVSYISYGGGLGVFLYFGNVNPMLSVSYENTKLIPHKILIKDVLHNYLSNLNSFNGWGFKVEAGIQLFNGMQIAYVYKQFLPESSYSFLNKQHNMHLFKIAIWGWGD